VVRPPVNDLWFADAYVSRSYRCGNWLPLPIPTVRPLAKDKICCHPGLHQETPTLIPRLQPDGMAARPLQWLWFATDTCLDFMILTLLPRLQPGGMGRRFFVR